MWEAFTNFIFLSIEFFYNLFGDWGLAIILITIIFRLILLPLMLKQTKSSYQMQKIQPLMKEIQEKYKDDQPRMQEEMQKMYAEAKFNPLAGCFPMLLQMPIFIALFQVLRALGTDDQAVSSAYQFYHIIPSLTTQPSQAITEGVVAFIPYLILMIIFAGATFLPMVLQQRKNEGAQKKQTMMMAAVMSVFMLFISWTSPAGVLLFWGTSSIIAVLQQQLTFRYLRKKDAAIAAEAPIKPIEVDVTRKAKKKKPSKKSK